MTTGGHLLDPVEAGTVIWAHGPGERATWGPKGQTHCQSSPSRDHYKYVLQRISLSGYC